MEDEEFVILASRVDSEGDFEPGWSFKCLFESGSLE